MKRGRPYNSRSIDAIKENDYIKQIIENTPRCLKLSNDELWTSTSVNMLIKDVQRRTINSYLKRWGITSKFPKDKEDSDHIHASSYYAIEHKSIYNDKNNSEVTKGEIHWLDIKVCKINMEEKKLNVISSVSKKKKLRFMIFEQDLSNEVFIEFLKRLIVCNKQKVYLVLNTYSLDNDEVKHWIEKNKIKIELHFTTYFD